MDILERMPWMAQNAVFQRLSEIADVASLNKEERIKYDANMKAFRDTLAVMEGQYLEGREDGLAEGLAKGHAEGHKVAKYEDARKMKAKGYTVEDIAEITGLTVEEIKEL